MILAKQNDTLCIIDLLAKNEQCGKSENMVGRNAWYTQEDKLEYTAWIEISNIATRSVNTHPFTKQKCTQFCNVEETLTSKN